jgi:hypothetical protein
LEARAWCAKSVELPMHNRERIWIAGAAWSVGLFAVLYDHFQPSTQLGIGVHALFAVVTGGAICRVLIDKARALAGESPAQLYEFTRLVSRWVYILLYALALLRVFVYLYEASRYCLICSSRHTVGPARPLDDFQFYVGCCLVSLWSVRALVLAVPFSGRALPTTASRQPANMVHAPTPASAIRDPRHAQA